MSGFLANISKIKLRQQSLKNSSKKLKSSPSLSLRRVEKTRRFRSIDYQRDNINRPRAIDILSETEEPKYIGLLADIPEVALSSTKNRITDVTRACQFWVRTS